MKARFYVVAAFLHQNRLDGPRLTLTPKAQTGGDVEVAAAPVGDAVDIEPLRREASNGHCPCMSLASSVGQWAI